MQTDQSLIGSPEEIGQSKDTQPLHQTTASPTERLTSIDVLWGFDMFWIVGGDEIAKALARWWGTPESKASPSNSSTFPGKASDFTT